ncbi:carbon-nitrogen hydrolase family protein [Rhizobium sp. BK251]|uniref:carbon-nitrogen hydrolase family protein n=1 Tax=Rhizobium sp. BK251 TaxID=2512125 RepID=UPI001051F68B|nr:carbon-nitrogen hydrolase family protein [Rhizobium sp. BK251]TCL63639.1 nitrilase [Rhizobium sp. BK251]
MKISLVQMNSLPDRDYNLLQAERLMQQAVGSDKPDLIVLPEHFDWTGGTPTEKRVAADNAPGGEAYRMIKEFAARNGVWVHAGSLLEKIPSSSRIFNTTVVFNAEGKEVGRYRKMHLFDVTTPDGRHYGESETVAPGSRLFIYEFMGVRIGCAICYDLRFSRLFDLLANQNVGLFILPAAFTEPTGREHWEVLCRARAIEFQAFFVACGQCGSYTDPEGQKRRTYGNSLVCDPWGRIIGRAGEEPTVISASLELSRLDEVRGWIPMADHRLHLVNVPIDVAAGGE